MILQLQYNANQERMNCYDYYKGSQSLTKCNKTSKASSDSVDKGPWAMHDFPNVPKRTDILCIPSKPYSVHSVHSANGSRMNRMLLLLVSLKNAT